MIIGAGTIGLTVLQLVQVHSPNKIFVSDLSNSRLEKAKEFGADVLINPSADDPIAVIKENLSGQLVDVVFEAVGVEATANQSINCVKPYGEIVWIGNSQQELRLICNLLLPQPKQLKVHIYIYPGRVRETHNILMSGKVKQQNLLLKL